MTLIQFLTEWALRSSILILSGALLLRALRVKDPSIRLAAWTAMLCGSLAIPVLTAALPDMPLESIRVAARAVEAPMTAAAPVPPRLREVSSHGAAATEGFDWAAAAAAIYVAVAGALLLRLFIGLAMTRRLLRGSRFTGRMTEGVPIHESDRVAAPVTLGVVRSGIVLPSDWREWDAAKLEAVLAHERSHIRRRDPVVQLLSAFHRAVLWHSPLSWFLDRRIVRLAEEASDDAAVAAMRDRASYAEVLLEFMQRGVRGAGWHGVSMARYGKPDERIHRILDSCALSGGVTRWSLAVILALVLPLAYVAAAARPQRAQQAQGAKATTSPAAAQAATAQAEPGQAPSRSGAIRRYMIALGDSTSGSWNSGEEERLRAKYGQRFAWFLQDGNEYLVTDAGVLAELERAMEPQQKVNRMQDEVNVQQSAVNEMQSKVNAQQNEVNALQEEVNRRQDLVNRIQAAASNEDRQALIQKLEAAIRELRAAKGDADQESANRKQAEVNEVQSRVNEAQNKVNVHQQKVNEEQARVSAEYNRRIQAILDSAVRRRLAERLM